MLHNAIGRSIRVNYLFGFYEWEVEGRAELQHMHTHQQTHKHTNT